MCHLCINNHFDQLHYLFFTSSNMHPNLLTTFFFHFYILIFNPVFPITVACAYVQTMYWSMGYLSQTVSLKKVYSSLPYRLSTVASQFMVKLYSLHWIEWNFSWSDVCPPLAFSHSQCEFLGAMTLSMSRKKYSFNTEVHYFWTFQLFFHLITDNS